MLDRFTTMALITAILMFGTVVVLPYMDTEPRTVEVTVATIRSHQVVEYVNKERRGKGMREVVRHPLLDASAQRKAEDMVEKGYFEHRDWWRFIDEAGYPYTYAGENLASGFTSAWEQHVSWMESPEHKKNIMGEHWREIGIGIAVKETGEVVVVQHFGRR